MGDHILHAGTPRDDTTSAALNAVTAAGVRH
jgi:hypothetical protein